MAENNEAELDKTQAAIAEFLDAAFAYLDSIPGPLSPEDEELICEAYGRISLLPERPPFSRGEWGFVRYSGAFENPETMELLLHRIPGGKAELDRARAEPRKWRW